MKEQLKKLKLKQKITATQTKIQNLYDSGFYTEAFLDYYILAEYVSKKIIQTHKAHKQSGDLSIKIIRSLKQSGVAVNTNNIDKQVKDRVSSHYFNQEHNDRDYVDSSEFISVLKVLFNDLDEIKVKKIMATVYKEDMVENGIQKTVDKKDTARNKRNSIAHSCTDISKEEYDVFLPFYSYIFNKILSIYNTQGNNQ